MKAISLREPWATAIAIGAKQIETRGWSTNYRGPLAIHAAQTRDHCVSLPDSLKRVFRAAGILKVSHFGFGCVIATCRLARCVRTEDIRDTISETERLFGGYENGRFAWVLEDVVRLANPVPAKGRQGFWNWRTPEEEALDRTSLLL